MDQNEDVQYDFNWVLVGLAIGMILGAFLAVGIMGPKSGKATAVAKPAPTVTVTQTVTEQAAPITSTITTCTIPKGVTGDRWAVILEKGTCRYPYEGYKGEKPDGSQIKAIENCTVTAADLVTGAKGAWINGRGLCQVDDMAWLEPELK